jgi:hypothetical protein
MSKNIFILLIATVVFSIFFIKGQAQAAISPIAIDIAAPLQFPPEDFYVTGLRVSALWGEHRGVYGIDIGGIGNISDQTFAGLAVAGGFNWTKGNTTIVGLQAAGLMNYNVQKTNVVGVQVAAVNSNVAESTIVGLEIGPIANLAPHTTIYGFQVGLYNKAYEVNGFQIGLLNFTTTLHGLQIGLVNFNEKGLFSVCPILNFGF